MKYSDLDWDVIHNADTEQLKIDHPIQARLLKNASPENRDTWLRDWNKWEIMENPKKYGPMLKDGRRAMDYMTYIVPPQADQVAFYNEYLDRAKSLLNRETPDERYERNRKELEQPMTPRERIQRLREMELMRQQFPDIGGIV